MTSSIRIFFNLLIWGCSFFCFTACITILKHQTEKKNLESVKNFFPVENNIIFHTYKDKSFIYYLLDSIELSSKLTDYNEFELIASWCPNCIDNLRHLNKDSINKRMLLSTDVNINQWSKIRYSISSSSIDTLFILNPMSFSGDESKRLKTTIEMITSLIVNEVHWPTYIKRNGNNFIVK